MTAVEKYNALDGRTVSREELQVIVSQGKAEGQKEIVEKISKVLASHGDDEFKINLSATAIDRVPEDCLPGLECEEPEEDFDGLEKAVSPDDIYQMITDKMLENIKEASGKGYKSKWKKSSGYLIPHNFVSKKPYRGINSVMLYMPFVDPPMKNPFFLTFNQIEKLNGKLKKGSKGIPVVYFTQLYRYQQAEPELDFGTYNITKMVNWLKKNRSKIPLLQKFSPESIAYQNAIPILKYYNVFRGEDVEGIDFDLDNFKVGYMGNDIQGNSEARNEIADLIIKNYPKPQVPIKHEGERAFYSPTTDSITLPLFENFETGNDYYRTAFHELVHSTGIEKRLKRPIKNKFGTPAYAKEELVAEFGSVFTSAHAGILWYNNKNHAEYLKNWSMAVKEAKEDNRFFMRAASKAQEAADFILNPDKEGVPAYQNSLLSESKIEGPKKDQKEQPKKRKKAAFKKGDKAYYTQKGQNVTIKKVMIPKKGTSLEHENRVYDIVYANGRKAMAIPESKLEKPKNEDPNPTKNPLVKKDTNQLLEEQKKAKIQAKTKAEFEKGLKKSGFEIVSYSGEQKSPQEWNRKYKLNYKDIAGVSLEMDLERTKKEFGGTSKIKGIGLNVEDYIYYGNAQEFYEEVLGELRRLFEMSVTKAADLKKEFSDTLFQPEKPQAQLGLFGAKGKLSVSKALDRIYRAKDCADISDCEVSIAEVDDVLRIARKQKLATTALIKRKRSLQRKLQKFQEKKGLSSPAGNGVATAPQPPAVEPLVQEPVHSTDPEPTPVLPEQANNNPNSLAARMQRNKNRTIEYYKIDNPHIAKFLGNVEIKDRESVGISITAPQGAGKTRFAFQLINAFAKNYKVGHASMEEHPDSGLYESKALEYIEPGNLANIDAPDIRDMGDIRRLIENNDVIVIDSFEKLREIDKNVQVDQDFRKKYDGKLFIFIFQLTSDGKMRGGSKSQFDVDIVLFTEKFEDYKENYIYPDKNRYNSIPPSELKFNIYNRTLQGGNPEPEGNQDNQQIVETIKPPGRLIATPVM